MGIDIRQAKSENSAVVASILFEAADWLRSSGCPLWEPHHIALDYVEAEAQAGNFFIAEVDGEAAGVIKFQLADPEFWPEVTDGSSAFIHRLAVRRRFAGTGVSTALIGFAASRAASIGRVFLRLDCAYDRPKLRAVYERLGFMFHSIFNADGFRVARYELRLATDPLAETSRSQNLGA